MSAAMNCNTRYTDIMVTSYWHLGVIVWLLWQTDDICMSFYDCCDRLMTFWCRRSDISMSLWSLDGVIFSVTLLTCLTVWLTHDCLAGITAGSALIVVLICWVPLWPYCTHVGDWTARLSVITIMLFALGFLNCFIRKELLFSWSLCTNKAVFILLPGQIWILLYGQIWILLLTQWHCPVCSFDVWL